MIGYFYCIKYIYGSEVSITFPLATTQRIKVKLHLRKGQKEKFCFSKPLDILEISVFYHFSHERFGFKRLYNFFMNDMTTLRVFKRLYKTMAFQRTSYRDHTMCESGATRQKTRKEQNFLFQSQMRLLKFLTFRLFINVF